MRNHLKIRQSDKDYLPNYQNKIDLIIFFVSIVSTLSLNLLPSLVWFIPLKGWGVERCGTYCGAVVVIKVSLSYLVLMWPVESQYSVESSVTSHLLHPHNKKWTHKTLNPRNSDQCSYVGKENEEWKISQKIFFYSDTEITSSHLTLTLENLFFTTKTLVGTCT